MQIAACHIRQLTRRQGELRAKAAGGLPDLGRLGREDILKIGAPIQTQRGRDLGVAIRLRLKAQMQGVARQPIGGVQRHHNLDPLDAPLLLGDRQVQPVLMGKGDLAIIGRQARAQCRGDILGCRGGAARKGIVQRHLKVREHIALPKAQHKYRVAKPCGWSRFNTYWINMYRLRCQSHHLASFAAQLDAVQPKARAHEVIGDQIIQ